VKKLIDSLAVMLGREPRRPAQDEISTKAQEIHDLKAANRDRDMSQHIKEERLKKASSPQIWRRRRWSVLIAVNLFFVVSDKLEIQALEGALTGSRFVGFHMADLNAALQVMLAFKQVLINLLIGVITVFVLWWLLGGRTFCSWVCPYHLLSELAEMIHVKLARRKLVKHHAFDRRARTWLWLIFAALAFVTGYTVFETISPTGILSRALIYGPGIALAGVLALLVFEILYSRRAWCRYACPIGLTYGLVGVTSPLEVEHELSKCFYDGACRQACLVPHALNCTVKGRGTRLKTTTGADCTRCGRCIDVCPTGALSFKFKGMGKRT